MQIGGKYSKFEELTRDSLKPLSKAFKEIENDMAAIWKAAMKDPERKKSYWNKVRSDLNMQYDKLDKVFKATLKKTLPAVYTGAVTDIRELLDRNPTVKKMFNTGPLRLTGKTLKIQALLSKETQVMEAMYLDALADWDRAIAAGKANAARITRRTQQLLIEEFYIDLSIGEAFETGNLMNNTYVNTLTMNQSLAGMLTEVATMVDGKLFLQAGSRRFSPKYYAELVTRTKFHEAQAYAAMNTALAYDTSLVQVSSHNTTTEICQSYEGKIYSINGMDSRFPTLGEAPPFHPNCLHLLFPMFESGMQAQGTLDQWVEFSNGEITVPPGPSTFVPVRERAAG